MSRRLSLLFLVIGLLRALTAEMACVACGLSRSLSLTRLIAPGHGLPPPARSQDRPLCTAPYTSILLAIPLLPRPSAPAPFKYSLLLPQMLVLERRRLRRFFEVRWPSTATQRQGLEAGQFCGYHIPCASFEVALTLMVLIISQQSLALFDTKRGGALLVSAVSTRQGTMTCSSIYSE